MESPDSPREDQVATVAGNLMGAAVMLLLLQVPIMVLMAILGVLLPGLGVLSEATGQKLGLVCGAVAEVGLVWFLARMVRRNLRLAQPFVSDVAHVYPDVDEKPEIDGVLHEEPSMEQSLERSGIVIAVLGVGVALLMGLGYSGVRVFLIVIEAFLALFLTITIATRWSLTRHMSVVALAGLFITFFTVWSALRRP